MKKLTSPLFRLGFALVIACTAGRATAADDDYVEIKQGGAELIAILESLPYASEGAGQPVMYMFEFSECPYCQARYRDFRSEDLGLELRHLFVPVSDRSARETAALGKSRNAQDYHAFMTGRKRAGAFDRDNEAITAYNAILTAASKTIPPILRQNGWDARGLVYPAYFWLEDGKLFANGGYLKSNFEGAVARARAGWNEKSQAALGGSSGTTPGASMTAASLEKAAAEPPAPRKSTGVDIVGIELGMTKDEAVAAIRAHNPKLQLLEVPTAITINDSRRQPLTVTSFISEIRADWASNVRGFQQGDNNEMIKLIFSGPPSTPRVQYIERKVIYPPGKGPEYNNAANAITAKYGEPVYRNEGSHVLIQLWQYEDKPMESLQLAQFANKVQLVSTSTDQAGLRYLKFPTLHEGQTYENLVDPGRFLGVAISRNSHGIYLLSSVLSESLTDIGRSKGETAKIAAQALEVHEAKLLGEAKSRGGPLL